MNNEQKLVPSFEEESFLDKDCDGNKLNLGNIVKIKSLAGIPDEDLLVWLPEKPSETDQQHEKLRYKDYINSYAEIIGFHKGLIELQTLENNDKNQPSIILSLEGYNLRKIKK